MYDAFNAGAALRIMHDVGNFFAGVKMKFIERCAHVKLLFGFSCGERAELDGGPEGLMTFDQCYKILYHP